MAVILGIGNTLLQDEGIGIHLLNYLKAENPHWESDYNIEMLDGGTLSFDLLANIQADQELLVLDAVNLKQAPGSVYCLQDQAMDKFLSQPGKSVHEVSLQDLLDMSRLTDQLPRKRALIGIQPEIIDWGSHLSQSAQKSLAYAAIQASLILQQWGCLKPIWHPSYKNVKQMDGRAGDS